MIAYIRLAIVFASGIYLSGRISPSFAGIFLLSLILVLTIKAFFKREFGIKILIMGLAFVMGTALCRYAQDTDRQLLNGYKDRYVTVTGRISEIPDNAGENFRYTITIDTLNYGGEEIKTSEKLLLTTPSEQKYGDTVTFSGFVRKLPAKMNESGFDFARYLKSKGVFFKLYAEQVYEAPYKISDFSPYSLGLYLKCFISDAVERHYRGDYAAVLKAVLTGNKKEFSPKLETALENTGLKRFYYPAYLHVILFLSVITAATGFLNKKKRDYVTVILLIIYALFNFSASVTLRICVMLMLLILVKRRYGFVYYPDVIGMTALVIGVINPLAYFDAGFVMSVLACVLIYYFYDSTEVYFGFIPFKYIRRLVVIGIICSVGLIPVCAYFWNGVSFHSVCVSFIMLPCVGIILVLSPLFVPLLALFGAAPVVGWAVNSAAAVLIYLPLWADKAGFLTHTLAGPGLLEMIIYVLLIAAYAKHIKKKKLHMYICLFAAAALCVSVGIREIRQFNSLEITFVNVGQGDGAIIKAPYRFTVLIDGGGGTSYSDYDPGEKLFLEYLRGENITTVDSAFVSHYHKDHVQGIIAAVNNLRVRNLFMPDTMEGSVWRVALETAAEKTGTKIHYLRDDTVLRYNNGMTIRVIPPAKQTEISDDENDTTYVYYVTYGDFSAMFTGDMSRFSEKNLIDLDVVPEADLLKVTHHGSRSGSSKEWIGAVNPRFGVISVGENNAYNLPNKEVLDNLSEVVLYRTDYDGDVRFEVHKDGSCIINKYDRRE